MPNLLSASASASSARRLAGVGAGGGLGDPRSITRRQRRDIGERLSEVDVGVSAIGRAGRRNGPQGA